MQKINIPSMEDIKTALDSMDIPYKEVNAPENQLALIRSFHYDAMPLTVDLTHKENVDAETGTVVYSMDNHADNVALAYKVCRHCNGNIDNPCKWKDFIPWQEEGHNQSYRNCPDYCQPDFIGTA